MNNSIIEFDTRPPITEAQFKSKIIAMSNSNKYQPIYDEFILKTKDYYDLYPECIPTIYKITEVL